MVSDSTACINGSPAEHKFLRPNRAGTTVGRYLTPVTGGGSRKLAVWCDYSTVAPGSMRTIRTEFEWSTFCISYRLLTVVAWELWRWCNHDPLLAAVCVPRCFPMSACTPTLRYAVALETKLTGVECARGGPTTALVSGRQTPLVMAGGGDLWIGEVIGPQYYQTS